ncbi:MAG TPA: YceD family protein [Casimicrobiaceae bacterium]|nr:YceD family protein [Casimicrobiaceae bacterium]
MSAQGQQKRFDAWKLAALHATIGGSVDPASLARLEDRVAGKEGEITWSITGTSDSQGRAAVDVSIEGRVPLICQRCLGELVQEVSQSTLLLLARDESEVVRLDESSEDEVLLADAPLDPLALVEDEMLLTLPFAPRHEERCTAKLEVA